MKSPSSGSTGRSFTLFEISWEVCSKVGGIHTVISTKAQTLTERFGDDYIAIGPWPLSDVERAVPFREEAGFEQFVETCRAMGIPVRVGRWEIPGEPRTVLVAFSRLYDEKDKVLSELWEDYGVDSISGAWDYVEPVLFGYAAGKVIEKWWEEYLAPYRRRALAQSHEWMTGSALLYLKKRLPSIGTIFTTHATMLGRALSSLGHSPEDGLGGETAEELARTHGVVAKHSIEGICARESDVFTTVSEITAKEAELLHRRAPEPLLPNGIDLEVVDALAGPVLREEARTRIRSLTNKFLGENVDDALLLAISGRYEFHNKGIDLLLDALVQVEENEGRRVVLFILVPAGNSGVRSDLLERLEKKLEESDGPIGISTHNLFDEEGDPVHEYARKLGFANEPGSRVKLVQIPIYLSEGDGFLDLPYEAVVRAMDLTAFPSYYEPWGYTPQESLAVGVPTITSDYAGFGRWARAQELGPEQGITVVDRVHIDYQEIVDHLAQVLETFMSGEPGADLHSICRATAARTSWSDLIANYEQAFDAALEQVHQRSQRGVPQSRKPKLPVAVRPAPDGGRPRLTPFAVSATLPEPLRGLKRLAHNYWWCWDIEGAGLFEELSPTAWEGSRHNPVQCLQQAVPEDLEAKADDDAFVARVQRVVERFDRYMSSASGEWLLPAPPDRRVAKITSQNPIAYFSAEFGIHESLRVYSGGLGVLAGDHIKSASDLDLPLVAVGLFYRLGYMTQQVSADGEQISIDVENDPRALAMRQVYQEDGQPLELCLQLPGGQLYLRAWRVDVGRVPLYLLDADTPSNRDEDRALTQHLYGGEEEMRLRQEIVLGRGGARLLRRLGLAPAVYHINEGHAAFLTLERVSRLVKEGLTFEQARDFVRATTLFTTHTPVPAGHDRFGEDLMRRYFSDAPDWVGVPWERFYALGQSDDDDGAFNMTYLALGFSSRCNAVSRLHGIASRKLLSKFWPRLLEAEVPVQSITNGIHLATWTHPAIGRALVVSDERVRGEDFAERAAGLPLDDLWAIKRQTREHLIEKVAATLRDRFQQRGDSPLLLDRMLEGLDADALLIGFARRFAPYKRAHLLFKDPGRLRALLDDPDRPVRIFISGKAHPRDGRGKEILRDIVRLTRTDDFAGKVFFVENYDIDIARALVQGVDVWLNNPTRMEEASGTSGMKAAANGALNLSVGDGWWPEAYDGKNGWRIADARVYEDQELQDQLDSSALYNLLEEEVVPLFFERGPGGVPTEWLTRARYCLETVPPEFNTDRMVREYMEEAYRELGTNYWHLSGARRSQLKDDTKERQRIRKGFSGVRFVSVEMDDLSSLRMGDRIEIRGELDLGSLEADDLVVELIVEEVDPVEEGGELRCIPLPFTAPGGEQGRAFAGSYVVERSGAYSYGIRARAKGAPRNTDPWADLVLWA